jgi:FkbM family methyltransferase
MWWRNSVPGGRKWIGGLMLHAPSPLRSLRRLPIFGEFVHHLSHQLLPADEKVWAQVEAGPLEGLWLELNPRTGQSYVRGEAEINIQEILAHRLLPGMVFYDLGSNIGLFTLLAARRVGKRGRVFSFEPDLGVAARLRRNIARNGFANVTVVDAGVWSASGNVNFLASDASSPDHGTGKFLDEGQAEQGIPIRCVALDDFIATAPPPDAIKCDVEGAEVEALRGAEGLLKSHRPWIVCEMHSEASNDAAREFLRSLEYTCELVDDTHVLALPQAKTS